MAIPSSCSCQCAASSPRWVSSPLQQVRTANQHLRSQRTQCSVRLTPGQTSKTSSKDWRHLQDRECANWGLLSTPLLIGPARKRRTSICQSSEQDEQGLDNGERIRGSASAEQERGQSSWKQVPGTGGMARLVKSKAWYLLLALTLLGCGGAYGYFLYQYADIPIIVAQKAAQAKL